MTKQKDNKICKYCLCKILQPYKRDCCGSNECLYKQSNERNARKIKNPIVVNNYRRKYQNTHRIQIIARRETRNMKNKENICFLCGINIKTIFHHISYKPNISMELCNKCHNYLHSESKIKIHLRRFAGV